MDNDTTNLDDEIRLMTVTQAQLARALKMSRQRVNQLIDEGIVVRDETSFTGQVMLLESLRNFFLTRNKDLGGDMPVNLWTEKALHEKAKRELAELKLAKTRGEVYDASTVERTLTEILANFRSKLLGLPAKYAAQLDGKSRAEISDMLTVAIEENLSELEAALKDVSFDDNAVELDEN